MTHESNKGIGTQHDNVGEQIRFATTNPDQELVQEEDPQKRRLLKFGAAAAGILIAGGMFFGPKLDFGNNKVGASPQPTEVSQDVEPTQEDGEVPSDKMEDPLAGRSPYNYPFTVGGKTYEGVYAMEEEYELTEGEHAPELLGMAETFANLELTEKQYDEIIQSYYVRINPEARVGDEISEAVAKQAVDAFAREYTASGLKHLAVVHPKIPNVTYPAGKFFDGTMENIIAETHVKRYETRNDETPYEIEMNELDAGYSELLAPQRTIAHIWVQIASNNGAEPEYLALETGVAYDKDADRTGLYELKAFDKTEEEVEEHLDKRGININLS